MLLLAHEINRVTYLSTEWGVLLLFVWDETSVDNAVLNGYISIIDIELRSIFISRNCRNKWFIRNIITTNIVLIENVITWMELGCHSISVRALGWVESITAEVLLLKVSGGLVVWGLF